ncbi:MAG: PQQ-binding-like beta-propeller repeat protein [Acidobacteria bacterium]|nr:PQQ-binding-like beta-propeller repeat protein [Acidobacteriota bacterium]MBI3427496.1 PQQ-binding-like beta-propeller repeat protein [Acidobacteriota bacterium]
MKNALAGFFSAALLLQGASGYKVVGHYPLPGVGGFDYVTLDNAARRIYVSHATQVEVVDADTGKFVGAIPDTPGVHGIAIATAFKHGFTSNGREHKVSMFDPATLQLIKKIDVGKGPDGIYYDPGSKRVFTNNHGTHDITAIDAATGAVVGTVKLAGDGEQAVIAADGTIYVNSEDTAEVVAFDPQSLEVKKRFPIGVAKVPTGLAYDAKTKRLFIGCRTEPKMVVMDAVTGKVINSFPIAAGVDYAGFDPQAKLIFFSCGSGTLNIFHEKSADSYEDAGAVKTQPSAKTMAFDPKTKKVFLPAVEYQETPATEPGKPPQRSMKPGTFTLLIVGK